MNADYYKKYEPIDGKWMIRELLGEGSYGKVFRIEREDISGKKSAALKAITIPQSEGELNAMRLSLCGDQSVTDYYREMAGRMLEEFNLMAELKGHSNIVSYEDHNIIPHEDNVGYDILIRMELLTPLSNCFDSRFDEGDVIRLGIDICTALESCQRHGIVHRDIKPENIFVTKDGNFKLGDFGVARTLNGAVSVMTKAGTGSYMAPELFFQRPSGPNVDIYSLGLVLHRLLNDFREPFLPPPPETFTLQQREEALLKRLEGAALPPPAHGSRELAGIIQRACAHDPAARYDHPEQMRKELERLLEEGGTWERLPSMSRDTGKGRFEGLGERQMTLPLTPGSRKAVKQDKTVSLFGREEPDAEEAPKPAEDDSSLRTRPEEQEDLYSPRSAAVAKALAYIPFTGLLGIHDLYLGKLWMGVLKFFTANFFLIGWVLDIIAMTRGNYRDKDGKPLR